MTKEELWDLIVLDNQCPNCEGLLILERDSTLTKFRSDEIECPHCHNFYWVSTERTLGAEFRWSKSTEVTLDNYVSLALRTESSDFEAIKQRLSENGTIRLLHSAMGLCTEAGELQDMLKRHIFYGAPLDIVNAREELGDSTWYIAIAIDECRTTLEAILTKNIEKLRKRYPDRFAEERALNRDLKSEREILEAKELGSLGLKKGDRVRKISSRETREVDEIDEETQHVMLLCESGVVVPVIFQDRGWVKC